MVIMRSDIVKYIFNQGLTEGLGGGRASSGQAGVPKDAGEHIVIQVYMIRVAQKLGTDLRN